jgi:hypothetical protein
MKSHDLSEEMCQGLPNTYIGSGDGCIEGDVNDPAMGKLVSYGTSSTHFWFVIPMQSSSAASFRAVIEAIGAVLATVNGYVNP